MYIVDLTAKNGVSWCHDLVKPLSIVLGWLFCIYIDRDLSDTSYEISDQLSIPLYDKLYIYYIILYIYP